MAAKKVNFEHCKRDTLEMWVEIFEQIDIADGNAHRFDIKINSFRVYIL